MRLITEEPIQRLHSPSTSTSYMQFRWNPASAGESEEWLIRPNDAESFADSGRLVLSSLTVPPRIIKKVKLDASLVNVIEVDVVQSEKGRTPSRLFWAKRGEHFRRENSLTEAVKVVNPDDVYTYRFHVGRHQNWSGRIKMLRFDPQPKPDFKPGRRSMILEVRGFRTSLTKRDLARMASKSWKVDLGHDLRDGLVTPPGLPVEREVFVPPNARLELSYGVWGPSRGVIMFRASATDTRSEKKKIILESTVDLTSKNLSDQWNQAEIDLSQFSGRTVSLVFEAEYDAPAESAQIVAVWGNPIVTQSRGSDKRPNVILLSIDTLRADHVSAYGYQRETTPELDRWIRRHGVVFENTVAPSPWTIPSHASMFTGLDALEHGTNYKLPVLPDHMLLTEYLRDAGYHTIAFTGGAFLHPDFGLAQGFDIFRYWPGGVSQTEELASNVSAAVQWIESAPAEPFFLFFHTYEVHAPFEPRQPFLARLSPSAPESTITIATRSQERTVEDGFTVVKKFVHIHGAVKRPEPLSEHETQMAIDLYDSGIAYMDSKIGYLLRSLENTGLGHHTVVVLTSDHGDALGEKGLAAHSYLYDFNLMIPLMIAAPGRAEAGRRVQDQVRLIDIVPTILDLAGVEVPRDISGISLVPFLDGGQASVPAEAWSYAASTNYGLSLRVSNRLKYIYNNTAWNTIHGSEELYQLQSDCDENDNRAAGDPETANLRNKVLARFREDAAGLHIRFRNPGSASIPCRLTGKHLIHPYRLKINGPACSYVTYKQRGEAEVDMHAGADFTLFAEGVDLGRIGLDLGCKNGEQPAYSLRMRLSELSQSPKIVAFLDQKWVEVTAPLRDEVPTVTISWHGAQVSSSLAENTGGQNQSLQQQLESLGYVE